MEFLAYEVMSWLSICKYHFDALCIGLNFKMCLKTWHWYIPIYKYSWILSEKEFEIKKKKVAEKFKSP